MSDINREVSIEKVEYSVDIDNTNYDIDTKNSDYNVTIESNDYNVGVEKVTYNVDINNIDYSIDITPQQTFEIQLNEQGPPGARGVDGEPGPHPISLEPISQVGYEITYRFTYSDGSYYDFTVTNGTGSMMWLQINESDWVLESGIYKYTALGNYIVISVYKGDVNNKELLTNIDASVQGNVTYLFSKSAFDGYALVTSSENTPEAGVYIHEQNVAASTWVIEHNLNTYPTIDIVNSAGSKVIGDVNYVSRNRIDVSFSAEFKGVAYLNYTR